MISVASILFSRARTDGSRFRHAETLEPTRWTQPTIPTVPLIAPFLSCPISTTSPSFPHSNRRDLPRSS